MFVAVPQIARNCAVTSNPPQTQKALSATNLALLAMRAGNVS
jgi:hypothetical protein